MPSSSSSPLRAFVSPPRSGESPDLSTVLRNSCNIDVFDDSKKQSEAVDDSSQGLVGHEIQMLVDENIDDMNDDQPLSLWLKERGVSVVTHDSVFMAQHQCTDDFRTPPPLRAFVSPPRSGESPDLSTVLRNSCNIDVFDDSKKQSEAVDDSSHRLKSMIPHTEAVPPTAQTVVLQKPLAPTKELIGSENMLKAVCVNTLDMGVQEENLKQNSVVNADRITQIGVPVKGTGNDHDQVSPPRGDSDVGLWRGYVVNSEFVCLLDRIMNKYPETFEHFTTTNKKLSTFKLNMLGNSVSVFTKISMTQVDTDMIAEHRVVFDALHKLGFNISWLVNRLNYIEQLRFSQPLLSELHAIECRIDNAKDKLQKLQIHIDDTKTELQDLHTLRAEKMQQIHKAFGTTGTNLVVGYIGDDLLSGP